MRWATRLLALVVVLVAASACTDSVARDSRSESVQQWMVQAEQGNPVSMIFLGVTYRGGHGVIQDFMQAAYWFRRAAEQGFMVGQYMLGKAYLNGHGVTMSKVQAHMWFHLAAAQQGGELARTERDELARRMTDDQIEEAQQLAREWKPKQ